MFSKTHNFVIGLEKSVPLVLMVADCTLLSNIPLSNDARNISQIMSLTPSSFHIVITLSKYFRWIYGTGM